MNKLAAWIFLLAGSFVFALGCGSAEVEYPENPTPPPQSDPSSTGVSAPSDEA